MYESITPIQIAQTHDKTTIPKQIQARTIMIKYLLNKLSIAQEIKGEIPSLDS